MDERKKLVKKSTSISFVILSLRHDSTYLFMTLCCFYSHHKAHSLKFLLIPSNILTLTLHSRMYTSLENETLKIKSLLPNNFFSPGAIQTERMQQSSTHCITMHNAMDVMKMTSEIGMYASNAMQCVFE